MLNVKKLEDPSEAEWLEARKKNINSTDTAALFGFSPYKTEFSMYHMLKGNIEDYFNENERTIIGQEVESGIARAWSRINKTEVQPFKDYLYDPDARIGSSFDYIITSGKYEGWLLEIKNVDYLVYRDNWSEYEAPVHIEIQCQHQCMVSSAPGVIILACIGGNRLEHIVRPRDEGMIRGIYDRIAQFWRGVDSENEPKPNYINDVDALRQLYSSADPDDIFVAEEDGTVVSMIANYKTWSEEIEKLKAMRESAKSEVYSRIGQASKVLSPGYKLYCGVTKDSKGKTVTVTEDMVGQEIVISKPRKGYRMFRVTKLKERDRDE